MTLPKLYVRHFRKRANRSWPVWELGSDVACGDVGTFEDKLFIKTGTLEARGIPSSLLETESNHVPGEETFSSHVDVSLGGGAGGTPAPGTELKGKVAFSKEGGVYFEAHDLVETRLAQVGTVAMTLKGTSFLEKGEVFVSNVWTFAKARLLIAESNDWSLSVSGKAPALPIKLADANVDVAVTGGAGYERAITGDTSEHPMAVRVFGRRGWFSDQLTPLSRSDAPDMGDYVDIDPVDD